MPVAYDPNVLQQHADALYHRANTIAGTKAFVWAFIGFFTAFAVTAMAIKPFNPQNCLSFGGLAAVIFALIGYAAAQSEVFQLKLHAQQALCQMSTEMNTRIAAQATNLHANVAMMGK